MFPGNANNWSGHRQKLEAQGRSLLINHSLPAPAHWWKNQTWSRLSKLLPAWICLRLEVHRPALLTLEQQISALSAELEAAAPADVPAGVGKLTTVVMTREICSWERFTNRRAISSYTGLCPGEHSSGSKRVPGSVTKHGNPRLRAALVECAWRMVRFQPNYPPVKKRLSVLAKGSRATGARAQKSHRRRGATSGGRSVAPAHRPLQRRATRIEVLKQFGSRGTVWNVACVRYLTWSDRRQCGSHRRFRLDRAHVPLQPTA